MFVGVGWCRYLIYLGLFKHGQTQDLLDFMKAVGRMQVFLGNGDQHLSADRDPDLRLDRVLVGAIKRLDPQVLLYPFKKIRHANAGGTGLQSTWAWRQNCWPKKLFVCPSRP